MLSLKKCALLMSSCDTYEDIWYPFYKCLDNHWKDIPCPVYLNTEHKTFQCDEHFGFEVRTLNQISQKKISWSKRFIEVLNQIPEEYILLVLDDFFLCTDLDDRYISEIIEMMDQDPSIASFQLYGTRLRNDDPENYTLESELSYRLLWKSGWRTHFIPTVWRKSVLLKWLRPWESIWGFEAYGSDRARRWNYKEKVYVVISPPVFDYFLVGDDSAVADGKWLDHPLLDAFLKENGIEIDYSLRGKKTVEEYQSQGMWAVIKKYRPHEIVIKSFNRLRSFF